MLDSIPEDYTQMTEDVADLKDDFNVVNDYFISGINMFNPDDPDIINNVELNSNGTTSAKTGYFASGFYPVIAGKTICCHYPTATYGSASKIVLYNSDKERISYVPASERLTDINGHTYIKYTFSSTSEASYFRLTGYINNMSFYMYVYASSMPATYSPYQPYDLLSDNVKVKYANIINVSVSQEQTDFIKKSPKNLNDLSTMEVGVINNSSSNGDLDSTVTNWMSTDYIAVEAGKTYILAIALGNYYGSGFKGICYYDANKAYKGHIIPTNGIQTSEVVDTFTAPSDASYIRTSYRKASIENPKGWYWTQIFNGSVWSGMYLAYDGEERLQGAGLTTEYSKDFNCLYGKSAMWNGDSICAADNDAGGGWPFRIGTNNGMYVKNYAIAGGCITENVGTAHSVCGTLDTMLTEFPDADYIIIEGGTNDADIIGAEGLGTFDADDFSTSYITSLDRDTFSGALESVFYRLVTQMKGKHIGFLIPQKMGHTASLVEIRRTFFDRAIDICKKWGIPYLDLWNDYYFNWELSAHWNQEMSTTENEDAGNLYLDGQHLTTTGYSIQSPVIAEWMKTI